MDPVAKQFVAIAGEALLQYDRRRPPKNSKVKSSQANEAEVANEAAKRHQVAAVRLSVPSSTCCCASGESTR
jgi:hypothetical protein